MFKGRENYSFEMDEKLHLSRLPSRATLSITSPLAMCHILFFFIFFFLNKISTLSVLSDTDYDLSEREKRQTQDVTNYEATSLSVMRASEVHGKVDLHFQLPSSI